MSCARCTRTLPSSRSRATAAQLCRETTWARIFARRPSDASGKRSYRARAIASSSTESPRNSRRSYDDARSGAHDVCVKTWSRRSGGRVSIRRASAPPFPAGTSLMLDDVVDRLPDRRQLLRVLVRDLDAELILELHDQLDQVERVGVEVFLERRLVRDLALVDAELLVERRLDALEDLIAGKCHSRTSLVVSGWIERRTLTASTLQGGSGAALGARRRHALREPL